MKRYDPAVERMLAELPDTAADLRYVSVVVYDPEFEPFFGPGEIVRGSDVPQDVITATRASEAAQVEAAVGSSHPDVVHAFSESFLGSMLHDLNVVHGLLERMGEPLPAEIVAGDWWNKGRAVSGSLRLANGARCDAAWIGLHDTFEYSETISFLFADSVRTLTFPSPWLRQYPTVYRRSEAGRQGELGPHTHLARGVVLARARALPRVHHRRNAVPDSTRAGTARHRRPHADVPGVRPNALTVAASISLADVGLPPLDVPESRPPISGEEYDRRISALRGRVDVERVVVYGDREHFANLAFFCGFDPRFEEALLVVGGEKPVLLVGNEGLSYTALVTADVDVVLCPSLSLMGQSRSGGPRLADALRATGIDHGTHVGFVGWKALEASEWEATVPAIAAPAFIVDTVRHLAGPDGAVVDVTPAVTGAGRRVALDLERGSDRRLRMGRREELPGDRPHRHRRRARGDRAGGSACDGVRGRAALRPRHVLVGPGGGRRPAQPERPTGRARRCGNGRRGLLGGLCCRAGLVERADAAGGGHAEEYLQRLAIPYWRAIATWYETIRLGETGGTIDEVIRGTLAGTGFGPALNPGHLTHLDEWVNSPVRPGSADRIVSGMVFQCDIIPDTWAAGWVANCEDAVAIADEGAALGAGLPASRRGRADRGQAPDHDRPAGDRDRRRDPAALVHPRLLPALLALPRARARPGPVT